MYVTSGSVEIDGSASSQAREDEVFCMEDSKLVLFKSTKFKFKLKERKNPNYYSIKIHLQYLV